MTVERIVVLLIGLPGSGKTTIANFISSKYAIQHLSTEALRAEYLGIEKEEKDCDFTEEQQEYVYSVLPIKAAEILETNKCVVIDGVFRSYKQRCQLYNELNKINRITYLKFWITCKNSVVIDRLQKRKMSNTICPAGINGYYKIKSVFEPPLINEGFITIENSSSLETSVIKICNSIEAVFK